MRLRRTVINHSSKLSRAFGLLLVSTVLVVSFVASSPSLSKYVLDKIDTEFSFLSGSIGIPLESVGPILGTTSQYKTLTAGEVAPDGATFTYQWQRANEPDATNEDFVDIPGATESTFYLDIENNNHYIRLAVKGTGEYTGTKYSSAVGPVVVAAVNLVSIGSVQGNAVVAQTVTAGTLEPGGASATFQWKISDTLLGIYSNIDGATSSALSLTEAMVGKFVRIYATGSSNYSGTVFAGIGPIQSNKISVTAIEGINGTTVVGNTLTAGTLTPMVATVSYQWQRSDISGSIFTDIPNATNSTYVPLELSDLGLYLRVVATGTGDFAGTVISSSSGPVVGEGTRLESLGNIIGTVQVGQTLTAGALTPTGATATYKWYYGDSTEGPWTLISGATTNTFSIPAHITYFDKYIKVVATGSGSFSDPLTGPLEKITTTKTTAMPLQSIGNITGSARANETVTAGTVLPAGATVSYQWRRYTSTDPNASFTSIGTNSSTYTLTNTDVGTYIRVFASGTGAFTGTVYSNYIVPVSAVTNLTNLISIADSIGLTQVFQTLTAGTVSPYGATVTYQWQRSNAIDGMYTDILGATSKTYVLTGDDKGFYFKVKASGAGSYTGTVISRYAGPITTAPLVSIGNISGTATNGQLLTAGAVVPTGATVAYQWYRSESNVEDYQPIPGATSNTYAVMETDITKKIRVEVTGTNLYGGTVTSEFTGPVVETAIKITALADISGIAQVGQLLTAGNTTPLGATVTYQWSRSSSESEPYTDISGATFSTYTTTNSDLSQYIKLTIKGAGVYTTEPPAGISSEAFGPINNRPLVAISNVIGMSSIGQVLTAGTVTPVGASVSYQWQWAPANVTNPTWNPISGATSNSYTVATADAGRLIRVSVAGTLGYTGTVSSNITGPVGSPNAILGIGNITGVTKVGQTLTTGVVFPYGATVSYQWYRSDAADGTYEAIEGATSSTYVLTGSDLKYIKVYATGYGLYYGEVRSNPTDLVTKGTVDSIGNILGQTIVGQTLSSGVVLPVGATVTYNWQRYNGFDFTDISGATLSSYVLTGDDEGVTVRLKVTGTGSYEGIKESNPTTSILPSGATLTPISIGSTTPAGTLTVGNTITAGTVSPTDATYNLKWQRSEDNVNFVDIAGAVNLTYTLSASDYMKYIRPVVTGTGAFTDTATPTARQITGRQLITAISAIQGTAAKDMLIRAGITTPAYAEVDYQWKFKPNNNKDVTDISEYTTVAGATDYYYKIPNNDTVIGGYYKLGVKPKLNSAYTTGTGDPYIYSTYFGPIGPNAREIIAISSIIGIPKVDQVLTAGTVTPFGAAVTYQWYRKMQNAETYSDIAGATSSTYRLTGEDYNSSIKLVVTGTSGYTGWVESEATSLIQAGPLTNMTPITGTTSLEQILTAGTLSPTGATATYQWYRSNESSGYSIIDGATSRFYTITLTDVGKTLKVVATGYDAYTDSKSAISSEVIGTPIQITAVGNITGTPTVTETLTVGAVTPASGLAADVTVSYQWMWSDSPNGTYLNIDGAISSSYKIDPLYFAKYIKVKVTGTGGYYDTQISTSIGPIAAKAIEIAVGGNYSPATQQRVYRSVIAFPIIPENAIVTYDWQINQGSNWYSIGVSTNSALIPFYSQANQGQNGTIGKNIRVVVRAVQDSGFSGTITGNGTEVEIMAENPVISLISMAPVTGTTAVGQTLTAGTISPINATLMNSVTYQWQRSTTSSGTFENIGGATSSTYVIQSGDLGYYFRVVATGILNYSGVLTSASTGPVIAEDAFFEIDSISDTLYATVPDLTLTAGTVYPIGATVTYQWKVASSKDGTYNDITGATSSTYTIPINQALGAYFKVEVIGSGSYSGEALSNATGPVVTSPHELDAIDLLGINRVDETLYAENLTAKSLEPGDTSPTATYRWQVFTGENGVFADIPGATGTSYTLQPAQYNYYIRVIATGSGAYTGEVQADTVNKVIGLLRFAKVTMAPPELGAMPQNAEDIQAITNHPDYEVTNVIWNEPLTPLDKFKAGTTYTATVTLTSKNTKTFVLNPLEPVHIEVDNAASIGTATTTGEAVGNTVTFTATFAPTGPLMPTSISVSTQPTKLDYIETTDGTLALDGMEVTETNNDGTITTTIFTDGTAAGYTAAPEDGSTLTGAQHNTSVTITHMASGKTATTNNLTVEAPPSASNVTISGTAAVDEELEGRFEYDDDNGDAQGPHTYRWLADGVVIAEATSNTYVLTLSETGKTIQFEVTPVAAEGNEETRIGSPVGSSATLPVAASAITSASVSIVAPVLGVTPDTLSNVEANTANDDSTVTGLTWNEALTAAGKFKADTIYTATVTLTSKIDKTKTFSETPFAPEVEGSTSVGNTTSNGLGIGNTVTFTVTFAPTAPLSVSLLEVSSQPRLEYTVGDTLDLSTLEVTEHYNDGSMEIVSFDSGTPVGYTTLPENGSTLTVDDNDTPVEITYTFNESSATVDSASLTVQAQPIITISEVSLNMTAPVSGATPQSEAEVETANSNANFTVTSLVWNEGLVEGNFIADTVYTATVILTSKNNSTFQEASYTPVVATASEVGPTTTSGSGVGNTVTFTVTFPETGP